MIWSSQILISNKHHYNIVRYTLRIIIRIYLTLKYYENRTLMYSSLLIIELRFVTWNLLSANEVLVYISFTLTLLLFTTKTGNVINHVLTVF